MAKAPELLKRAADIMEERGKQYDKPDGERSMAKTVQIFNLFTNREQHPITEHEGWLFMQILKDVRQWQTPHKAHPDSLEDCIAYAALKAEAFIDAFQDETTIDGEWIDWDGQDSCPVSGETRVDIQLRDGEIFAEYPADNWGWRYPLNTEINTIVKYRIHKEDK